MCFSVSIVRFGWAGGPQRQFGSFRGWVCRLISFLQMENSLRSDSSICRNNAARPNPKTPRPVLYVLLPFQSRQPQPKNSKNHLVVYRSCNADTVYLCSTSFCCEIWCEIYCSGAMSGLHQSNMECFFLCNGDETPEIVKPTGAHDFCFSEVHRNVLHKETRNI